ncbi:MAG TPA: hypothetical protein VFT57_04360 [Gemmatimonadaceae bacterium]|nr:hypothetical protein [Gemmatimonadaceae bacterium]
MNGRCYTLDVNPTSGSRVKVRLYETRAVREGGNILLLQGQLSVRQFQALEALLLDGGGSDATEFVRVGRYYSLPAAMPPAAGGVGAPATFAGEARRSRRATALTAPDPQPRAPWITGPVIGPDGAVDDDDVEDDYAALAHRHVERMLGRLNGRESRKQRAEGSKS